MSQRIFNQCVNAISAAIAVSLVLTNLLFAQEESLEQDLEQQIDEVMAAWDNTSSPGAAVAYVANGEIVFQKAYGLANLEHRIAWSTDTVSDLGSVSKQFIGFAFALLQEQGLLSLDDDIRTYLPEVPDLGETITIKHLFNHTSGLREIYNTLYMVNRKPGDVIFQEDAKTLVQYQANLQFEPGSQYLYNNTEYMLLADIVEAVTGQEFHQWMDDNIFQPLEMDDTVIMHQQGQVIPRVASSYVRNGEGEFTQRYDNSTIQGAGGIYSTVEDMTRWIGNYSNPLVGSASTFETLTETGLLTTGIPLNYGLGITVDEIKGVRRWSHSGSSAGYRSMFVYLPDHDRGFIYQTNTPSNGSPARELSNVFLGDVFEIPDLSLFQRPATPEPEPLENPAPYLGRYLSDELEAFYTVQIDNDQLTLVHRWLGDYEMSYRGEDEFGLSGGGSVTFSRDDQNDVAGFVFDNGRTIGVEFRRLDQ